ncbi:uncharacterized protein LOC115680691 isoform X2 [Syzygium oleosum]|uniref:uncharacterized protein LOC115680691 isoform X2 n=1 Tax=Syzygium oleosum TaxID=219896 RepID=UPI0011D1B82C|nr:uncharacterized protein LOC115680691 isoform X2 [Syzygium oleosum]
MDDRAQGERVESVDRYWSEWAREADLPTDGRDTDEEASDDINGPLVSEEHYLASSLGLGSDSGDVRMQTTNVPRHHSSLTEGNSVSHSFPILAIRPPATGTSSGGFPGVATCGIAAANKESGRGTLCSIEEPHAVQNREKKLLFEASQVSYHLKRGDNLLEKSWSERDDNRSKKKDFADDVFDPQWRTKFGHTVSDVNIDSCSLLGERNRVSNSPLSFEQHAIANTSNKRLDDAMRVDSCYSRPSCLHQTYSSDIIHERSKRNVQTDLSTDYHGFEPHWPMQCSYEVGKAAPEKGQQLMDYVSKTRNIMNNSSFDSLSRESFTSTRHGFSSPTSSHSLGRASTVLSRLCGTESVLTEQAHLVVKSMHCLSELFLFQSSNGPWVLKDEDYDILKSVIDNLSASLKHFRRGTERQQLPSSPPRPAQLFGKSTAQVKSVRSEEPQIRSVQANDQGQSILPHLSGERKRYLAQGDPNKVDSVLVASDDLDNVGNDKMTQAIKKILIDNLDDEVEPNLQVQLFKNLWLEAEAALCSMKFKSCFKRVKTEMERLKSFQRDSSDNLWDMEKLSSSNHSSYSQAEDKSAPQARCHVNQITTTQCFPAFSAGTEINDVVAGFNILKERDFNSNVFSAGDKVECVSPENSKLGHDSNDVLARFNILKGRDFNSNALSAGDDVECVSPEDSKSRNLMEADESTSRACPVGGFVEGNSDNFPVNIPTKRMENANASVMERLSILRQRDDSLVSVNIQPRPEEAACLGSFLKKDYFSGWAEKTDVLSFSNSAAFLHQTANPPDQLSTLKDVRAIPEDDEAPQSQCIGGSANLNFARRSDSSSSSDWELCGERDLSAEV